MLDLSFGRSIKLGIGLMLVGVGAFPLIIAMAATDKSGVGGSVIFGIIFVAIGIWVIYDAIKGKERISASQFNQFKEIKLYGEMNRNCNKYKNDLVNDNEITLYNELCKRFPSCFNNYAGTILNMPIEYSKPLSTTTSAAIGTAMGGLAVGFAAAQKAERARAAYKQNQIDVFNAKMEMGTAYDKIQYCYNELVRIINKNETSRNNWNEIEASVDRDLREKYKVR